MKRHHKSKVRDKLFIEQKGKCFYCQKGMRLKGEIHDRQATIDHVKARSKGGYDRRKNMVLACRQCNSAKGKLSKEQFQNILKSPTLPPNGSKEM